MLSLAAVHLKTLYDSALEYLRIAPAHTPSVILREGSDAPCLSIPYMRRDLEFTRNELARTKNDVAMLEERCKILEKTLKDTRDMLRVREAEMDKVRKERDRERKLTERKRSDSVPAPKPDVLLSRRSSVDVRPGRSSKHAPASPPVPPLPPKHVSTSTPEDRARLRSTEVYLTRTDSWSGAQVIQALQDINSEILQFAASATEVCAFAPTPESRAILASRSAQAMRDTTSRLGPKFARILSTRDHSQDPLLVQWALQGSVALCLARALSAFCLGFPAEADSILSQIHRRMSLAALEAQPTSSKWRALTHKNIHAVYPTLDDYAAQKLTDTIIRWSADVFLISGCTSIHDISSPTVSSSPPNPRSLSTQASFASLASSSVSTASTSNANSTSSSTITNANATTPLRESLKAHFGDQVRRLARSATRLATTLREEILSTSFDVIAMDHTHQFNPATMYDYMAPHAQAQPGGVTNGNNGAGTIEGAASAAVLATTELGLLCTTRMGNRESIGDEDVTIEKRLLLKPRVVLENVLEMLD
ncbi:hypothetical protein APHAL10511_007669 [Amanita phalloides]|nr:hypothetical protein APHAL10511_007669 [Amanita phalloides]